jgi:uncharacterized protein YndB with AHSA1/START domain
MADDLLRRSVTVPVDPGHAFDVFATAMAQWWPPEYTWAGPTLQWIGLEPRVGGPCFERGPHGFRCDWGRVLLWQPPRRLVLAWQISPSRAPEPDPERASEVEVGFAADGEGGTRVELEHRHISRHGEGSDAYREAMASPHGWSLILERYAALLP